jgi:hypothetical protein
MGNSLDQSAMNALTADIRDWKIGAVLVTDISGIARRLPLVSEWLKPLFEHGVTIIPSNGIIRDLWRQNPIWAKNN